MSLHTIPDMADPSPCHTSLLLEGMAHRYRVCGCHLQKDDRLAETCLNRPIATMYLLLFPLWKNKPSGTFVEFVHISNLCVIDYENTLIFFISLSKSNISSFFPKYLYTRLANHLCISYFLNIFLLRLHHIFSLIL